MTIELNDLERESLVHTIRVMIAYVFYRLRDGAEQPHPDRHDRLWYSKFVDDINHALRLHELLEKIDPSEKEDEI